MKEKIKPALAALIFAHFGTADATNLYCVGSVSQVFTRSDGELLFKAGFRGDYVAVCNLLTTWKGVQADVCKNWYATLLTAQLSGSPVTVQYVDINGHTCNSIPNYGSAPSPGYVLLGNVHE